MKKEQGPQAQRHYDNYFSNEELENELRRYEKTYPDLCSIEELGRSFENRPIWLMTLTNSHTGKAENKPAIWADANLHATEISGTSVILRLISTLLTRYKSGDEQACRILDTSALYLAPRLCPDGADRVFLSRPEFVRSGIRPYPYEDLDAGLHIQDLDGDGRILQMRVQDAQGDWKISSLDPLLMEKRRPHEQGGVYYRLFPEGLLNDFDGHQVKLARPKSYLDYNRNFPYHWRAEGEQVGAGPFPTSEPEVRAVVNFVAKHPNINLALLYHTYGGLLLRPYDDKNDENIETRDLWVYDALGEIGSEITGYTHGATSKLLKYHPKEFISGTEDSWLYDERGIFAWTVELWNLIQHAGVAQENQIEWYRKHPHSEDKAVLDWYTANVPGGAAYVSWYPYDHPQLGPVELGGWNKLFAFRNPPVEYISVEADKNVGFVFALSDTLPRIVLEKCEVRTISEGIYTVTVIVENIGFLPTFTSEQARKQKAVRPVRAELCLSDGQSLLSGKAKQEIGHLEGRSNKLSVTSIGLSCSETDNRGKVEWTVQGKKGTSFTLKVLSERAGSIQSKIELP